MTDQDVRCGSGPRGAQALALAAKVQSLLDGRFNVSFADVKKIAVHALRHRMLLNFEGEAENLDTDTVVDEILQRRRKLSKPLRKQRDYCLCKRVVSYGSDVSL